MDENLNHPIPDHRLSLTIWSILLGASGILANCCCMIWNLPGGIFFGIAGVVTAVLSKKGRPFTHQAMLGLILSIIAIVIGVIMFAIVIFTLYMMRTDPTWAAQGKIVYQALEEWMNSVSGTAPAN